MFAVLVAPLGATFELSNAHLRLQIESSARDAWFSFVGAPASEAPNLLSVAPQLTPLWEAQFATSDYLPGAGAVSLDLVSADGQRTRLGNFSGGAVRVDRTVAGRSIEMLEMSPL